MDLRSLEYVVAVADTGGFTSGASAVHVAQPSISQAVRAVERELGLELFVRSGRGVRLTAAGEVLVDRARRVLRDAAELRATAAELRGVEAGRLDVVALPTLAVDPLAPLVGELRRRHPGLTVTVREPETAAAVGDWVRSGRAELGLTDLSTEGSDLRRIELPGQELVAVCPPNLEAPARLRPAALARLPLIASPPGTSTRRLLDAVLDRAGGGQIVVETDQREAIVSLVLAGAGTALLPAGLAREAVARGAVARPLVPALTRHVGLIHRAGPLSPAAAAFVEVVASETIDIVHDDS